MDKDPRLPAKVTPGLPDEAGRIVRADTAGTGPPGSRVPESDIDWRRWVYVLWRRKWWIIVVTALGTALSVWSARGVSPVYQARAMVWVEAPQGGGGPIEVTNVFSTAGWIDLLRSYAVIDAVVHDLRLYLRPARGSDWRLFSDFELTDANASGQLRLAVGADSTMALLDAEGVTLQVVGYGQPIGERMGFRWVPPDSLLPPGSHVDFTLRRPRDVANAIVAKLEVKMADAKSNFIGLTYRGTNPLLISDVLNGILDRFVSLATELKRQKLRKLASTLEEQLELAAGRLRRAESQLQTFRVNTIALPDDRRDRVVARLPGDEEGILGPDAPIFGRYFSLQVERDLLRQDRDEMTQVLANLAQTSELDGMRLEAIPSVRTSTSLLAALEEMGRKEVEQRALLYRYTPEHAEVQRLTAELDMLKRETIPGLVRLLMGRLAVREAQLDQEISSQRAQLQEIPPRTIEESRLRRGVTLAEQLYNSLEYRYKEAQVAEAATQPNVRVLDRASPPARPVQNAARLRIVLGFVLSLGLSLAGVIAHVQLVDRRLQYPEQVVDDLGLPILGVVPNLKAISAKASGNGQTESPAHVEAVVESFRALRTQLTLGLGIQYPAVIAVTSPAMGEGKSLITSNLALAFADPDRATILIDGDARRGRLHRIFNVERCPGLAEYLRGEAEPARVVKSTETEGLHFMPRGRFTADVPELLDGEGMPALLAQLKQTFKVILIDTPPLAAGVDAVMIGAHADAVIAVLRKGRTDLDLARAKVDSYARMLGVPIVGAILNDVDTRGPYRYYTYAYGYYTDDK